ncbi:MAG: trehalose-phosphatase [Blastocatellia bacterium]|nr:trehalose-phosphatase [Blastocatellia bacterium]
MENQLRSAPDRQLLNLLNQLANRPKTWVHLVSGRPREALTEWFQALPIGLHAEHGYWSRFSPSEDWVSVRNPIPEWKSRLLPILEQFTKQPPDSLVEEKTAGLVWHYRMANPEFCSIKSNELFLYLTNSLSNLPVEVMKGEKIVEIRPQGVHKGIVLSPLWRHLDAGEILTVAFGDDRSDEDLVAALPQTGISVHVGGAPSRATHRVASFENVRQTLHQLLN